MKDKMKNKYIIKYETKLVFKTITINLLFATVMMLCLLRFDFSGFCGLVCSIFLNLSVGIAGLYFIGFTIGQNLYPTQGRYKQYFIIHGIVTIFLVLILGVIIGSMVGFLEECLPILSIVDLNKSLKDYVLVPLFVILIFG